MKCGYLILLIFLFANLHSIAQANNQAIQKANDLYKQQQYGQAEAAYKEVLDKDPGNATAAFNRANALYRQARPEEAMKALDELVARTNDAGIKAKAWYNKGVMLSGQKKLEESIEAYKNALRNNPNDKEARENLQKALLELKKKTPKKEDQKKKQEQKKQQPQPKMSPKEAEQRMKLLEQKEKEVQQKRQKTQKNSSQSRDW